MKSFIYSFLFSLFFSTSAFSQESCKWCNSKLTYGDDFWVFHPELKGILSAFRFTHYEEGSSNYDEGWESKEFKFCNKNHIELYDAKITNLEIAKDKQKAVTSKHYCNYCGK